MSDFIVSARKYRPATFQSVVGQKHITSTLKNAIERGQLAHAYLFCGPRGVGKTTCARIFAKAINCLSPNGAEACNECESCRSFIEGRSLNIHELEAASNNSVEDIRTLIEQVRIIPQIGRYSVFIIDEVHMLSAAAFNAFLKTLEEPPQHAIFILATTEKHKIIPTILSRCQIYDFNRIRVEDAVEYLKYIASNEGVTADEESLNLIAQKADGGMRDALSMFDKAVSFCGSTLEYRTVAQTLNVLDYDTYFRMTDLLVGGNYTDALVGFDEVLQKGFSGQTFMAGLNRHLRDLLMAKQPDTLPLIEMTGTLMERYRTQAQNCDPEFLFGSIAILTELDGRIRQASNARLLVELGLMKIARLGQKKKIEDDDRYPLPELTPRVRAAEQPKVVVEAPKPAAVPTPPVVEQPKVVAPAVEAPKVEPTPVVETPKATEVAMPKVAEAPTTKAEPRPRTASHSGHFGTSLSSLLNGTPTLNEQPAEEVRHTERPLYDPKCEEKLNAARERILNYISHERPRFVPSFEQMTISNFTIGISVPTQELHDEIVRNQTALLTAIAREAGIEGKIDLEVTVNEQIRAARPFRLEDRLRYMTEKNPLLVELKEALGLEFE